MHNNAYFGTSKKKKKKSIPLLSKYILYFVGTNHGSLLKSVVTKSRVTVLNCANVCLPNILRTVQRTMIRFLIELLVRRTWFGQFGELYFHSQLACNEMQASARTSGRRAADSMIENVR